MFFTGGRDSILVAKFGDRSYLPAQYIHRLQASKEVREVFAITWLSFNTTEITKVQLDSYYPITPWKAAQMLLGPDTKKEAILEQAAIVMAWTHMKSERDLTTTQKRKYAAAIAFATSSSNE
jgi:hypothetical protein